MPRDDVTPEHPRLPKLSTPWGTAYGIANTGSRDGASGWYVIGSWDDQRGTRTIGRRQSTYDGMERYLKKLPVDSAVHLVYHDTKIDHAVRSIVGPIPSIKILVDIITDDLMEISPP